MNWLKIYKSIVSVSKELPPVDLAEQLKKR